MTTDDITIRVATHGDAGAMAVLAGELGYPTTQEKIEERFVELSRDEHHVVLVAETEDCGVVGWIHLLPRFLLYSPRMAEIGGLVIEEKRRGQGIGRALTQAGEKWAQSKGYVGIVVRSNSVRRGSHEFYPRIGYTLMKTQHVYLKEFGA
ncbi:GNAT family N-acetyltransferase [Candidatus Hydrogenedentota bacterium]